MTTSQSTGTNIGMNRTGIGTAPILSAEMREGAMQGTPVPSLTDDGRALARVRKDYTGSLEPVGTMPPPSSFKGLVNTTVDLIKGQKPSVFLDKLGERLGFERSGIRLYAALIDKLEALGSWNGGPTRPELEAIQQDELRHFDLLREMIESLGADSTAMTPGADISGTETLGVVQVLTDPRTTLPQALHAILTVELLDNTSWEMLIQLAESLGHDELAMRMKGALRDEARHLAQVRAWVTQELQLAAKRELQEVSAS